MNNLFSFLVVILDVCFGVLFLRVRLTITQRRSVTVLMDLITWLLLISALRIMTLTMV